MYIFLLGFMGSGKSYYGQRLAAARHLPFVELDAWVEAQDGRSIANIFAEDGEAYFRQLERDALHRVVVEAGESAAVVATGGGTPCHFDNLRWMKDHGHTIFLDAAPSLLLARLAAERSHRPLLAGTDDLAAFIEQKTAERRPYYAAAHLQLLLEHQHDPVIDWINAYLDQ